MTTPADPSNPSDRADPSDFAARIAADGAALVAACRAAPGVAIPACPGWTTEDLLHHIAEVHEFWTTIIDRPLRTVDEVIAFDAARGPVPDADTARLALLEALASHDDNDECWTWGPDQRVGFVRRFQATEALIHRVDGQQAAALDIVINPADAGDSIDVFLHYCLQTPAPEAASDAPGSVEVQCTDTGATWFVADDGAVTAWANAAPHDGGDADLVLRGTAAQLLLVLWRRAAIDTCEVLGPNANPSRFRERCTVE